MGPLRDVGGIAGIQHLPTPSVLQTQQACSGEVGVLGLDGRFDVGPIDATVAALRQGLGLDAAQHRRTPALPSVGVRHLTHQVFVTARTVGHQGAQVALRARGHEQGRLEAQIGCDAFLQGVDTRVVTEDVVTHLRAQHGLAHGGSGARDGVAAKVDHGRGHRQAAPQAARARGCKPMPRKLRSMACPCSLRMDSGWNCTPSIGAWLPARSR